MKRYAVGLSALAVVLIINVSVAKAQGCPGGPGCLDASFGTGGKTIFPAPNAPLPTIILEQSDGKVVTAGRGTASGGHALARINANGIPDASFGNGGLASFLWSGGNANDAAIQLVGGEERFLVAGTGTITVGRKSVSGRLRIDRLLPNGSLDPSWGNNGVLAVDLNSAYGIAVDADQKILLTSSTYGTLMRLNSDGSLDRSFGSSGQVNSGNGQKIMLDSSGRIYVAGIYSTGRGNNVTRYYFIRRFSSAGVPDNTFGVNGTASSRPIATSLFSMAIDAFGNILLGSDDGSNLVVERFTSNGQVDTSFSSDGYAVLDYAGGMDRGGVGVKTDPFGRVIVSGNVKTVAGAADTDVGVFRLNYDGSLDPSFGSGGKVAYDIGGVYDYAGSVILQDDPQCSCQKIVVAGGTTGGATNSYTFARLFE